MEERDQEGIVAKNWWIEEDDVDGRREEEEEVG